MKKILFFVTFSIIFAFAADPGLETYQERYSLCHCKTDYQISDCILNGRLNFANFRGDRNAYRKISKSEIMQAVKEGRIFEFTMQHIPDTERYRELKQYLDYLYEIKAEYTVPRFDGNETEDIIRIKHVFNLLQFAGLEETAEITPAFKEEVLKFQSLHGLAVDGDIGRRTRHALQRSIKDILAKVKKNLILERISQPKPSTYILVNIPEFKMHYYEDGEEVLNMKIVVGKTKMRTPVFNRNMKFVVLNPTWNVPPSIYKKEYAHKSEEELRKLGLRYGSNGKLYQPSGRRNALGLVKFLFPNRFNVYMHDTPAKSLFSRSRRAYSHGCIRLEKPMDLLHKLGYSYHPGKTIWKTLEEEIPVFVEYHTVWVNQKGSIEFRPDVYGYERKLFSKPVPYFAQPPKSVGRDVISDF